MTERDTARGDGESQISDRDGPADAMATDVQTADLPDVDLHDADLRDADLRDADLRDADLRDVDLRDVDLRDADLRDAALPVGRGRVSRHNARGLPVAVRPVRAPITVVRRSVGQTAALRESLAAKEAEANELRDSIDQLRQELDAERSHVAPARRQRNPWLWLLAGLIAFVLLMYVLVRCTATPTSTRVPGPAPTPSPTSLSSADASAAAASLAAASASAAASSPVSPGATTAGPTPSSGPTASGSGATSSPAASVSTTPMAWPGGAVLVPPGIATTGPGVDRPGSDVTYALDADGSSVDVFERLRLAAPVTNLAIALPRVTGLARDLGALSLGVRGLQVELDGTPVTVTRSSATAFTASRPDGRGITAATLRYTLTGAVVRLEPAKEGRYAGLLAPLTGAASLDTGSPVGVRVIGSGIRSLVCPAAGAKVLCGSMTSSGATGTLPPGTEPVVQLQLDRSR